MISKKEKNEIINFLIDKMDSVDLEFPFKEIEQMYRVTEYAVITEILKDLSNQSIIKESGNTFQSGCLLSKGLEIKRNGGWLKQVEFFEKGEENKKIREEVELENLRYAIKLSKLQINGFYVSLFVGFFGGLSGLIALILQLSDPKSDNSSSPTISEKIKLKSNFDSTTNKTKMAPDTIRK